jgi:hypothetical protein
MFNGKPESLCSFKLLTEQLSGAVQTVPLKVIFPSYFLILINR